MACSASNLDNMSDISSEENDPPPNTISIKIKKKSLEDNMMPSIKAYSVLLTNKLFDACAKWNCYIDKTDHLVQQINDLLTAYLLENKYYVVNYDTNTHDYKITITKTTICSILENLNNYGGSVCNSSATTCSCLMGICSLLNIDLNFTANLVREYSSYTSSSVKSSCDHTISINLIKKNKSQYQPQPQYNVQHLNQI